MKKACALLICFASFIAVTPLASAKTHKDNYSVSCDVLWAAVKDTIRNSGKYGVIAIDNAELTASFNIGGALGGKRINSVILNRVGPDSCEMQTQTAFSGITHNDAGDFKKRVEESIANLAADKPQGTENAALKERDKTAESAAVLKEREPDKVKVIMTSEPVGADIEVDGAFVGNTPSQVELDPGEHTIVVKKDGYQAWERKIRTTGSGVNLRAELKKTE